MSIQTNNSSQTAVHLRRRPSRFFVSLIWGVLVFIALCIGFEFACRSSIINQLLPVRSVGSYHAQFEIKWFKLEDYVRQNNGVDVIILGNSMVNTGIDPQILAERYKELTGKDLRIFNFGIEGLTVAPLADVAQILEQKYHPGTILLYTEMRDYIAGNGNDVETQFLQNAWMRSLLGTPSLQASLISSSSALQHLLPYRNWSQIDFLDSYVIDTQRIAGTTPDGYEADYRTGKDVDKVPDPNDPAEQANFALFKNYTMDPSRIKDLQSIIQLQDQGTKVLVAEFPAYITYYRYTSADVVANYNHDIAQIVGNTGSVYLPAVSYDLITLSYRSDNHHLNYKGAALYSTLLAEQLAALCNGQQDCLAAAKGSQP
jgi:hypothetical protein